MQKLRLLLLHSGKVDSFASHFGSLVMSQPGNIVVRKTRSFRLNGLFGGKKDNNEKSEEPSSKVLLIFVFNLKLCLLEFCMG
uniref:Uncharacterized protein n=1 Tax=Rhizophora mucronata TaxID=61149 RepID=A0A2P2KTA2_RHIMU